MPEYSCGRSAEGEAHFLILKKNLSDEALINMIKR
jgi:hypothetical protein